MDKRKIATLILLHILLMIYSLSGVFSKLASGFSFADIGFYLCYAAMLGLLAFYALGWQQVIKRLPLTTAFANRAVTVIWGIVWGVVLFSEPLNANKIIGALVVLAGVALFTSDNETVRE